MINTSATTPCSDTSRPRTFEGASLERGVAREFARCTASPCGTRAGWVTADGFTRQGTSLPSSSFGAAGIDVMAYVPTPTKQAPTTGARAWSPPV